MDNIKESKEYKLAKEWEMAVNSFSFNGKSSVSCPLKPSDSAPLC